MGKKLFLFAAAAVALASCTETDLSGDTSFAKESTSDAIQFSAKAGNSGATRAGKVGSMTNESIKASNAGFGVFAYYSEGQKLTPWGEWNVTTNPVKPINKAPNFMYNQKVTWSTTDPVNQWNYEPVKYWPNGTDAANGGAYPSNTAKEANPQYLSFFAYAPFVYHGTTEYQTANEKVGGDLPAGVTAAVYTGDAANPTAPDAVQNGIVAMSKNTNTQDMYVKYILNNATETNAVDLLWGLRGQKVYQETDNDNNSETTLGNVYNNDLTKQIVGEKVNFLFKHALSRVGGSTKSTTAGGDKQVCGVWVVVDVDKNSSDPNQGQSEQTTYFSTNFDKASTLVTIESVKIRDAYTYTVTEDGSEVITNEESDFLTDGWFDVMNGTWTNTAKVKEHTTSGNGATYSVTADNTGSGYGLNEEIKENGAAIKKPTAINQWQTTDNTAAGYTGGAAGVELTKKKVFADEDVPGLLLIPGAGGNTLYITVKYHVRTADPNLAEGYSHVTQEITNKVQLDGSILKPNKYYNLVMHLGLTSVKFEAVVANWSNGDNEYNEDGSEEDPATGENNTSIWLPSNVVQEIVTIASPVGATAGNTNVNLTGLTGTTLQVVSVDGTVVKQTTDVTNLSVTSGSANINIAYAENSGTEAREGYVILGDKFKTIKVIVNQNGVTP